MLHERNSNKLSDRSCHSVVLHLVLSKHVFYLLIKMQIDSSFSSEDQSNDSSHVTRSQFQLDCMFVMNVTLIQTLSLRILLSADRYSLNNINKT